MTDISEHTNAICEQLGLEPRNVRRLDISRTSVMAEVFKINENGSKYIDLESGEAAMEIREFEVRT